MEQNELKIEQDNLKLNKKFEDKILIIKSYLTKRAVLGYKGEIFGICTDESGNKSQYGKIALLRIGDRTIEKYKVPDFVDTIGFYRDLKYITHKKNKIMFSNMIGRNHALKEITLGKNVETIAPLSFRHSNIEKVKINGYLNKVEHKAFEECEELVEFDFNKLLNASIGLSAFIGCSKLKNLDIRGVNSIDSSAFAGCKNASSIIIGDRITRLSRYCFNYCNLNEIIVPDNVIEILSGALGNNYNIRYIKLGKGVDYLDLDFLQSIDNVKIEIDFDVKNLCGIGAFDNKRITLKCSKENADYLIGYNLKCKIEIK